MLERLRDRPIATPLAGAALAGVVAVLMQFVLPDPYPIVVGLAIVIPLLNVTSSGGRFDVEAYEADRGATGMIVDAVLSVVAGVLLGSLVATLMIRWGAGGLVLVGLASIATIVAGIGMFAFRNTRYYETD